MSNSNTLHHNHHDEHVKDLTTFGFWLYLMTDCILFGSLFATFIVLSNGVTPYAFDLSLVLKETFILLTSSFTFGLAMIKMHQRDKSQALFYLGITFLLGAAFIYFEISEFMHLMHEGNSWSKHAYFSAFFTLVGTHGLHVAFGLMWIISMMVQILIHGITPVTLRKLTLLSLFWHFLDIVWIFVFSIVYLIGGLQ